MPSLQVPEQVGEGSRGVDGSMIRVDGMEFRDCGKTN
jgi:hypothetical protein